MGRAAQLAGSVAALALIFAVAWGTAATTRPQAPSAPPIPVEVTPPDPAVPPGPSRVALVDGYRVRLDGDLVPGRPSQVFVTVTRDGVAVTDLEPHLGAFGHLVALRLDDLTLLQVRPDTPQAAPTDRSGPGVAFTTEPPTRSTYRLYLEFRHAGTVRTATFTLPAREVS
jgi:hypothetical protein